MFADFLNNEGKTPNIERQSTVRECPTQKRIVPNSLKRFILSFKTQICNFKPQSSSIFPEVFSKYDQTHKDWYILDIPCINGMIKLQVKKPWLVV